MYGRGRVVSPRIPYAPRSACLLICVLRLLQLLKRCAANDRARQLVRPRCAGDGAYAPVEGNVEAGQRRLWKGFCECLASFDAKLVDSDAGARVEGVIVQEK